MTEPERVPINVVIGEPTTIAVTATNTGPAATGVCLVVATAFIKVEQFVDAEVRGGRFSDWAPTAPYAGAYNLASLALDQLNFAEGESAEVQFRFTLGADIQPREVDGDASLRTSLGSPDVLGDKGLMHLVVTAAAPGEPLVTLESIDPTEAPVNTITTFTITGTGFESATAWALHGPDGGLGVYALTDTPNWTPISMTAVLMGDVGITPGSYDLHVTATDGSDAVLANAVTITEETA